MLALYEQFYLTFLLLNKSSGRFIGVRVWVFGKIRKFLFVRFGQEILEMARYCIVGYTAANISSRAFQACLDSKLKELRFKVSWNVGCSCIDLYL